MSAESAHLSTFGAKTEAEIQSTFTSDDADCVKLYFLMINIEFNFKI